MAAELLAIIWLGTFTVTGYRSVPNQTDASPYHTSIGWRTNEGIVAVSQDLLCPNAKTCKGCLRGLHYGEAVYIEGVGVRIIADVMNARWKQRLDVWVPSEWAEHEFYKKFKTKKPNVFLIRIKNYEKTKAHY